MLVIRFANPRGIDFPYLLSMLHDSFMSRPNTIVSPGGKMDLAMQLILTPMIWRLMQRRKQALHQDRPIGVKAQYDGETSPKPVDTAISQGTISNGDKSRAKPAL
jgi:hypothetical protein